jgi:two-component system response regulator FixJ
MMVANAVVHVIDDDESVRHALAFLLATSGMAVRVHESGTAFLETLEGLQGGCIVTDIRMPGIDGLALQRRLTELGVNLPVIVMTGHGDVPLAVEAMKAGAVDFIEKPFDGNALVDRVVACLEEEARRVELRSRHTSVKEKLGDLTQRDREVMERMLAGKYNKVIADELGISMRTVEVHRSAILRKMGVRNAIELARLITDGHWESH